MDRNLFIDYDGTLIDSRRRQYELFVELIGKVEISLDQYWNDKRDGMKQSDMLKLYSSPSPEKIRHFSHAWMKLIEEPKRLKKDKLISGALDFLGKAKQHFKLHLVTGRQNRDFLIEQMHQLGIYNYFTSMLNTAQRMSKANLMCSNTCIGINDVFIGDSGEDILTGKELGIFTVAVASGASSVIRLKKYTPDLIVSSVEELDLLALGAC
ncbi:HAD family hydrolase [Spartinivicinus ruber]|uniref:HAD family hydrolase n=1 Tax=Spartinivicinus ruber TaxID=2683272 RepID=UPI0013D316EF|nr:HAD hydrolase-like protein [Spartinivicinus ruber]